MSDESKTTYYLEQSDMQAATHIVVPRQVWTSLMSIVQDLPYRQVSGTLRHCEAECFPVRMAGRSEPELASKE